MNSFSYMQLSILCLKPGHYRKLLPLLTSLICVWCLALPPARGSNPDQNLRSGPIVKTDSFRCINFRGSLNNSRLKFTRTGKGRVVFLGGSITNMNGWRQHVMEYLKQTFPQTEFDFINAGIPSTGSVPGAFRLQRDVFSHGPVDLLFEEAAVNDRDRSSEQQIRGMEGIIRQARLTDPELDIVMMHFVDPSKMEDYNKGLEPLVIDNHEKVASHYQVTSINLAREVNQRINAGQFTWENDFKDLHPAPFGHRLYAESMIATLENGWDQSSGEIVRYPLPDQPLDPFSYYQGKLVKPTPEMGNDNFHFIENWIPQDSASTRAGFVDVPVLEATKPGAELTYHFAGTVVGVFVVSGPDAGIVEYKVDQGDWQQLDLFTQWSHRLHLPKLFVLADQLHERNHKLHIRISATRNEASQGHACRIAFFTNKTK